MTRTVEVIEAGGVSCRMVAGGGTVASRSFTVHVHQDWGVLGEMGRGLEPVPWESAGERDAALRFLATAPGVDDALRARLAAHVRATPVWEGLD